MGSAKRTRSNQDTEDDKEEKLRNEVADLTINGFGYSSQDASGFNTRRKSSFTSPATSDSDEESTTNAMNFDFTSICTYRDDKGIDLFYEPGYLEDCVEDLWNRLKNVKDNVWEKEMGEYWQHEFTKTGAYAADKYVCVTRRCQKKRTSWGTGREPGMWACADCVKAGLPCFTYETQGGFYLLPLHTNDRTAPVEKDKEVRWWINEKWTPVESDDEMEC